MTAKSPHQRSGFRPIVAGLLSVNTTAARSMIGQTRRTMTFMSRASVVTVPSFRPSRMATSFAHISESLAGGGQLNADGFKKLHAVGIGRVGIW